MPRRQLIGHIFALRRISEERPNELDQLLGLIIDKGSLIKEVADVCQGCLLQGKPFEPIPKLFAEMTYQEFGKIRKLEPRRDTPNDEGRLYPHGQIGKSMDA